MGVIYIGDRFAGKTHLVLQLASPGSENVTVLYPPYGTLQALLDPEDPSLTRPTDFIDTRGIEIDAKLSTGTKEVNLDWVDTPGEMWREYWQEDNPEKWQSFLEQSRESEGILLILSPSRDMLSPAVQANTEISAEYINQQQWCNRFEQWVEFFRDECPKARHIVICLNKADLFVHDLNQEAKKLSYSSNMTWRKRHNYVVSRYFRPIRQQLEQLNKETEGLSAQCFVTSIHSRPLLELPWIYLATYLAK